MKTDRPYLVARQCGRCLTPLEMTERREGAWFFATYYCPKCGFRQVVTFSPAELEEWARRGKARAAADRSL